MLIVRQRQNSILVLNLDSVQSITCESNGSIIAYPNIEKPNDEYYLLGNYESEKANRYMRDLISAYANNEKVLFMPEE